MLVSSRIYIDEKLESQVSIHYMEHIFSTCLARWLMTVVTLSPWVDCVLRSSIDGVRRKLPAVGRGEIFFGGQRSSELHRATAASAVKRSQRSQRK